MKGKIHIKIYFHLCKYLLILKIVPKAASKFNFCSGFLSCYWSIFSGFYPLFDAGKIRENLIVFAGFRKNFQTRTQAALGTFVRAIGGYQKAGT
jgi:hypothetical protein